MSPVDLVDINWQSHAQKPLLTYEVSVLFSSTNCQYDLQRVLKNARQHQRIEGFEKQASGQNSVYLVKARMTDRELAHEIARSGRMPSNGMSYKITVKLHVPVVVRRADPVSLIERQDVRRKTALDDSHSHVLSTLNDRAKEFLLDFENFSYSPDYSLLNRPLERLFARRVLSGKIGRTLEGYVQTVAGLSYDSAFLDEALRYQPLDSTAFQRLKERGMKAKEGLEFLLAVDKGRLNEYSRWKHELRNMILDQNPKAQYAEYRAEAERREKFHDVYKRIRELNWQFLEAETDLDLLMGAGKKIPMVVYSRGSSADIFLPVRPSKGTESFAKDMEFELHQIFGVARLAQDCKFLHYRAVGDIYAGMDRLSKQVPVTLILAGYNSLGLKFAE